MILSFFLLFFFFKQKTAYEMRISDWSSDVCSSDLASTLWDVEPDGRLKVRHGDSFIMFVTWDRDGRVRSESIQPFGAATTRPASPHYNDQAPLFAQHKLKPVLFDPAALKASGARFYRP